jgi:hypothetical protein
MIRTFKNPEQKPVNTNHSAACIPMNLAWRVQGNNVRVNYVRTHGFAG